MPRVTGPQLEPGLSLSSQGSCPAPHGFSRAPSVTAGMAGAAQSRARNDLQHTQLATNPSVHLAMLVSLDHPTTDQRRGTAIVLQPQGSSGLLFSNGEGSFLPLKN